MRLRGGTQRQELDAGRFASGIYFVKMSINGKTVVRKLVKN
ncbi:MAG: T9SS type A sorting domain-containing protein [Hymenobacter sp.]|nr:MAG: T9SS type A sorting domain-containing protein [Hymenobacter sp.]